MSLQVGIIPFGEDTNPYQELTRRALVAEGLQVSTFPKSNFLPLWRAARSGVAVLHSDWPHSFYRGANGLRSSIKRLAFRWQLLRLGRIRLVWTVHNLQTHNTGGNGDEELRRYVARADALVSLSEGGVEVIRQRWPEAARKRIVTIPHGHYSDWYRTDIPQAEARRALGMPLGARIGALVGRLQPYKGIEELVPSFSAVAGKNDWLIIAGAPVNESYATHLRQLALSCPRIRFLPGWVAKPDLEQLLCAADYAVFAFKEIFNSGSVILAMTFGLPVIATRRGTIPEVVPPYAWFDAGDGSEASLRTALGEAMRSGDLAESGRRVREHVLQKHSWQVVGSRLKSLYEYLVCRGPASGLPMP